MGNFQLNASMKIPHAMFLSKCEKMGVDVKRSYDKSKTTNIT